MSWREQLKVGILSAERFFLGNGNGSLGEDVTDGIQSLQSKSAPLVDSEADMTAGLIVLGESVDISEFTPAFINQKVTLYYVGGLGSATVKCGAGVVFNEPGNNLATFLFGSHETYMEVSAISLTRWIVLSNTGVTLSTVA